MLVAIMLTAADLPAPLVQDLINLAKRGGVGRVGFNRTALVRGGWLEPRTAQTFELSAKALAIPAVSEALN